MVAIRTRRDLMCNLRETLFVLALVDSSNQGADGEAGEDAGTRGAREACTGLNSSANNFGCAGICVLQVLEFISVSV